MPGAVWFPGAQVNYAAAGLPPRRRGACRRPPGDRLSRRGDAARRPHAGDRLAGAAPPGRRVRGRARRDGRRAGRSRRRLHAERAADGGRVPRLREPRRDLVGVLGRHGAARGPRPLPPDRAEGAGRVRRLSLRRRRARPPALLRDCRRRAAERSRRRPLARPRRRRPMRGPLGVGARRVHDFAALVAGERSSRAAPGAVRRIRSGSSTRAERPACRRRSSTATAASCSRRSSSARCTTTAARASLSGDRYPLVQHDRLDHVELADVGAARRRHDLPLRRQPGRAEERACRATAREIDWTTLWRFVAATGATFFGAGAAFYASCEKAGIEPADAGDLSRLRALGSTGSPLAIESYRWAARARADGRTASPIWLTSVSGGTDFAGASSPACATLAGGRRRDAVPLSRRGGRGVVGARRERARPRSLIDEVGELVCTKPMPSMPLYFWGDEPPGPHGRRLHDSYFDMYPGVWRHGDWLRITPRRRRDHLRPQRRDHQPARHPHGNGRAVPRGRGDAGGARQPRRRPRVPRPRELHAALRRPARRASRSTTR